MSIVSLQGGHKAYGNHTVLGSADVTLSAGERVGVVGLNGAGKSTLARILAGREPVDGGVLQQGRGTRVLYLHQTPTFEGDPSAEEAVVSGLSAWVQATERHAELSARLSSEQGDPASLLE